MMKLLIAILCNPFCLFLRVKLPVFLKVLAFLNIQFKKKFIFDLKKVTFPVCTQNIFPCLFNCLLRILHFLWLFRTNNLETNSIFICQCFTAKFFEFIITLIKPKKLSKVCPPICNQLTKL